jgi:hypothetical protein
MERRLLSLAHDEKGPRETPHRPVERDRRCPHPQAVHSRGEVPELRQVPSPAGAAAWGFLLLPYLLRGVLRGDDEALDIDPGVGYTAEGPEPSGARERGGPRVSSLDQLVEHFLAIRDERIRVSNEYKRTSEELALAMQAAGLTLHKTPKGAVKLVSYTRWRTKREDDLVRWLVQHQFFSALDVKHSEFTALVKRYPLKCADVMHEGLIEPTVHLRVQVAGGGDDE